MKQMVMVLLIFALVLFAASFVFSEGQKEKSTTSTGQKVVDFTWQSLTPDAESNWKTYFIEPYMEKNPDVKIEFSHIPENRETFRVQLAAGAGPDIFPMDAFDIKELAEADRIMALDNFSEKYGWQNFMWEWAYNSCIYKGKLFACPYAAEVTLLWYNKTFMDDFGWSVPTTRAEFERQCKGSVDNDLIAITYGFSGLPLLNQWLYDHYINAYAGADKLIALLNGNIKFSDPDITGSFQLLKDDWDRGWWNEKMAGGITIDEARSLFYQGKGMFNSEGTWLAIAEGGLGESEYEFRADAWPSMKQGVGPSTSVACGEVILMNKNAEYPDACADILNFLYTELDTIGKGIGYGGMEMLCRDVDTKYYPDDTDKYVRLGLELTADLMNRIDNIGYAPWGFYPNKTNQYLMDNLDKVFMDRETVEEYLTEAQEKIEEDFEDGYQFPIE